MRSHIRNDGGSALPLMIALVVVLVLAVAVVVDVGAVLSHRRALAATADTAAMAGAQAIDLDAYYRDGASAVGAYPLAPARVESAVRAHLAASNAYERHDGLRVESVSVDEREVVVRLQARVPLPMISGLGIDSAPVRAASGAQLLIQR